jgi:hypothetical protein
MTAANHRFKINVIMKITLVNGWWEKVCILCLLCAATVIALPAQTFVDLLNFDQSNGAYPSAALVQGADGNFYGTTSRGGPSSVGHDL